MELDCIDNVIVTREFALSESARPVIVEIGRPAKFPDGQDYYCPYRVVGLGNDRVRYAGGVDQVQALLLTLKKIGAELYTCAEYKSGKLYWLEAGNNDLGFPTPDGFSLGAD